MTMLVTGATGGVGRWVIEHLLAEGAAVRAMTRDAARARLPAGCEVVEGDFSDPDVLARALDGISAMFLYAFGERAPDLMQRAARAGVRHVAFLSSSATLSERPASAFNRNYNLSIERAIAESGLAYTFLRPCEFASNALLYWRASIARDGVVRVPFPEAQQAPIDERDIAAVAAGAMLTRALDGEALLLTGPASISVREEVEAIGAARGAPVKLEVVSVETARRELNAVMPSPYVDGALATWAENDGAPYPVTDQVSRVTGRPATRFADWALRHADAFRSLD